MCRNNIIMEKSAKPFSTVIALGSNHGNRLGNIAEAAAYIESLLDGFKRSSVYETPALNGIDNPYMNSVAIGTTSMPLERLNALLKNWESTHGRTPEARLRHEVTIDLDIVFYGNMTIRPDDATRDYFLLGYNELTC